MTEPDSVADVLDRGTPVAEAMPRHYPIDVTLAWFVALHQGMVDRWRAQEALRRKLAGTDDGA